MRTVWPEPDGLKPVRARSQSMNKLLLRGGTSCSISHGVYQIGEV